MILTVENQTAQRKTSPSVPLSWPWIEMGLSLIGLKNSGPLSVHKYFNVGL